MTTQECLDLLRTHIKDNVWQVGVMIVFLYVICSLKLHVFRSASNTIDKRQAFPKALKSALCFAQCSTHTWKTNISLGLDAKAAYVCKAHPLS